MNELSETPPESPRPNAIAGKFVTETFDYDDGRQVTVYLPPDPPEAIVFASDGQMIAQWGGFLEAVDVPPTMIVGAHRVADETLRLHEYSPGFDPARFAAHERFYVEDVRAWVRSRFGVALPAGRTAVCGVSAGAELALALGLRHPGRYSVIFASSPGAGYRRRSRCRVRCRAPTSWPARWNRFSSTTRLAGRLRCAMLPRKW